MSFLSAPFMLVFVLLLFFLLYVFVTSGNPFYDLVRLPRYWFLVNRHHVGFAQPEKIKYGPHPAQYHLFIAARNPTREQQPAILFIHGGGWQFGKPALFLAHAEVLSDAGYPVYLMCHRKVPRYHAKHMLEDLDLGFQACQADLSKRIGEKRKIIVGGMSSGGNLAALLFLKNASNDKLVAGFFQGAPLDLTKMPLSPSVTLFAGRRKKALFQFANPISYLKESDKRPVLITQGLKDGMVPPATSISFFKARLKHAPQTTRLILWPEGNHFYPASWSFDAGHIRQDLLRWLEACWSAD
ncbi:MAG: alpha/beta hydrolase [Saprospiraceae bacterium]|nr:alpha/beta hydrolase [Saprospiraceae bacterium]